MDSKEISSILDNITDEQVSIQRNKYKHYNLTEQ